MPVMLANMFPQPADFVDNLASHTLTRNIENSLAFLQSPRLNQQFVLCLLDEMWLKLFPELQESDK